VSLRDIQGNNIFAISNAELQTGGRSDASYSDTKFLSQEGEWFLAGILDGIADGTFLLSHIRSYTHFFVL
jgi:glutamine synthetase